MITIPERMRGLDKDHRGYPIPFIVYRDDDNKPHFTINDTRKVDYCKTRNVCAVCGTQLFRARWFLADPCRRCMITARTSTRRCTSSV